MLGIRLLGGILGAFLLGKLVSRMKLPAILGWLIAGMILGPNALGLMTNQLLNAPWYEILIHILECVAGLMIGVELVWQKIRKTGKQIIITTLTQSLGTFLIVTVVFGVIFYWLEQPLYLAFVFGGIALATAPAPALSVVREFQTDGPVTRTLIPMAALDDLVGVFVFFTVISLVASHVSGLRLPFYIILLIILLPIVIGVATGFLTGSLLKRRTNLRSNLFIVIGGILLTAGIGLFLNNRILASPVLNFMIMGMAFSATFANMISEVQLLKFLKAFNPILGLAMIIVILNLGAPLDYHLILGAGMFTVIYILARAFGKYFGAYLGASLTHSPATVKKYLGLTLLPHSGVSLVFTGIAVSVLKGPAPESAAIVQGTIAAAAVINEIIAVIVAKKGFELAGEFHQHS